MSMGMDLFDQRIMRTRILDAVDHEIVEIKMRELIEKLLEKYTEEIRQPARVFISWLAGVKRDQRYSEAESQMLGNMVKHRESSILPNNMEALRVYADLVKIGAEVSEARIKMIEERTSKPFKVISNPNPAPGKKQAERRAGMRRVV
jgi:hypothetical protein